MTMPEPRLLPVAHLVEVSAEVYQRALSDAFEIGLEDGAAGRSDVALKDPACDEDVVRAYLRGWERGAGLLKPEEQAKLRADGR
jgi:hypothetical protein